MYPAAAVNGQIVRYIGGALRYMFKNFIFIFVFALLPSYFLAMSVDLDSLARLVRGFFTDGDFLFYDLFFMLSPVNPGGWPFAIAAVVCILVCMPMLLGLIEKHMRLGIRTFKGVFGRFDCNFLATCVVSFVFFAVYEVWALITAGLLYAESLLFAGIASSVVVLITLIGLVALLCYGASFLLSWLPCRLLTGCGYMEALRYSNQLAAKKRGSLFLAVFLPVAACLALDLLIVGLSSMGNLNIPVVLTVELLVLLLFLYYASLMFVAYFALTGEERMDLPRQRDN